MNSVGIFWTVPSSRGFELICHQTALEQAEPYGECLTCPLSHYDVWETTKRGKALLGPLTLEIKRLIIESEYEEWPRGRVVYYHTTKSFVIYADMQIFEHAQLVYQKFSLPDSTPMKTDPHYRSSRRLKGH